jgi:ATP-dependent protease ClpP protease subunit
MNIHQRTTLAALADWFGRREIHARAAGLSAQFTARRELFKAMAETDDLDEAQRLYHAFTGDEMKPGTAAQIKTVLAHADAARNAAMILPSPSPFAYTADGKKLCSIHLCGEIGFLQPVESWLEQIREADEITLLIDSMGGCSQAARRIVEACAGKPVEVVTRRAYSAAALIAQVGTRRKITEDGGMMIHALTITAIGTPEFVASVAADGNQLKEFWTRLICNRTGLDSETVNGWLTDGLDYYFTPAEAVAFGLADEIVPAPVSPR